MSKKDRPDLVEVEIYDQRYPLRLNAPAGQDEIRRLAERVDGRMREIARQTGTVDSLKVAILTALHLAGEGGSPGALETAVSEGCDKWIAAIDRALK